MLPTTLNIDCSAGALIEPLLSWARECNLYVGCIDPRHTTSPPIRRVPKELKTGKQLFRDVMPNILRRLSRSLSTERKTKDSVNLPNKTMTAKSGECREMSNRVEKGKTTESSSNNGGGATPGRWRRSKRPKSQDGNAGNQVNKNNNGSIKIRRKFWSKSGGFGSQNGNKVSQGVSATDEDIKRSNKELHEMSNGRIVNNLDESFDKDSELVPCKDWIQITDGQDMADHDFNISDNFVQPQKIKTSSSFFGERTNQNGGSGCQSDKNCGHTLTCNVCEHNIKGGDVLKIEPGTWIHSHCFICAMCNSALDPNAYYEHNKKFMCVKDYHRVLEAETRTQQPNLNIQARHQQQPQPKFQPTNQTPAQPVTSSFSASCPVPPPNTDVCTLPYRGTIAAADKMTFCYICELKVDPAPTSSLVVMGRLFHAHCFTCLRCGRQPKMGQQVNIESKRVICSACIHSTEKLKTCQGCLKPIMPGEVTLSTNASPATGSSSPSSSSSPMKGSLGEKTFHRMCFRCSKCNIVISDEFFFGGKENLPHCLRCYKKHCDVTCLTCEQLIIGTMVTVAKKRYHPGCAFCSVCGGHFKQGQDMLTEGDEIWHPMCSTLRKSIKQMENYITGTQKRAAFEHPDLCNSTNNTNNITNNNNNNNSVPYIPSTPKNSGNSSATSSSDEHTQSVISLDYDDNDEYLKVNVKGGTAKTFTSPQQSPRLPIAKPSLTDQSPKKCYTHASYLPTDTKRLVPDISTHSHSHEQQPKPNSRIPLPFHNNNNNNVHSDFALRMTLLKYQQQSRLGGRALRSGLYTGRRKMQPSRLISREPTIVESELENEFLSIDEHAADRASDRRGSGEDSVNILENDEDIHLQEDNRSNSSGGSTATTGSSNDRSSPDSLTHFSIDTRPCYDYSQLKTTNSKLPHGVDRKNLEKYLSDHEFFEVFQCRKHEFYKLPRWRRDILKRERQLF